MKKKIKSAGGKAAVIVMLLTLSQSVFAGIEGNTSTSPGLSAGQVILYFVILIALIVAPVFKSPERNTRKH